MLSLPVTSLDLRMCDDSICIATGLRLGALCQPHRCELCGDGVGHLATHGMGCKRSQGSQHSAISDIIRISLVSAKIPSRLEPSNLMRSDSKRPGTAEWTGDI